MAKISPISGKYIVHASIQIDGIVDRPDIIGAIFGQTEGLLGADLELRELQRSGRIGRIEVNTESKVGKTTGEIIIPSSLDKAETVIVAAALEIIERIGPCNARIEVKSIEDIRVTKRQQVIERAKELLRKMHDSIMPDSADLADQVSESIRVMEIAEWGPDKLPAGPAINDSDEIIVVEGRADVLNLLKHGFKNAISMNGTNAPPSLVDLCRQKTVTVFVDGDRGGLLNIKELMSATEIDFIARAPDGKEVEELAMKEIHKALRARVVPEQMKNDLSAKESLRQAPLRLDDSPRDDRRDNRGRDDRRDDRRDNRGRDDRRDDRRDNRGRDDRRDSRSGRDDSRAPPMAAPAPTFAKASEPELQRFAAALDDLVGTHAASLLDAKLEVLGKVPLAELASTLESLEGSVYAVVLDGAVGKDEARAVEKSRATFVVGRSATVRQNETRAGIVVIE